MFLLLSGLGCGGTTESVPVAAEKVPDPIDDNYRVFYQIFVGSFSDSDGDGIGDLKGIINRMDYLNDGDINSGKSLGVQGIWLSPVFKSPSYHKYDVTDYYTIDPAFGSEDDLKELIDLCHERNVKVIADLVLNHTSSDNSWFSKFKDAHKNGYTDSEFYDFYTWAYKDSIPGGRTFRQIPGCSDQYYECNFSSDMPELNFDNETVRKVVRNVAEYWLDRGVDGFRFDAVKYIYFGDTAKSVSFWKQYMDDLNSYKKDVYCVGECWSGESETLEYISAVNCFNFQIAQAEGYAAVNTKRLGNVNSFTKYVEQYQKKVIAQNSEYGMPVSFISNHDMDRTAGYMLASTHWAHMVANLYILSPGSPFIYYGEEIGMKGARGGATTDANRRLAMLWGDEDTVKDPKGSTFASSKQTNGTVAEQEANENSLLNYYKKVIALRVKYPEIGGGNYKAIASDKKTFSGFKITRGESTIWLFHNTEEDEFTIDLSKLSDTNGITKLLDHVGQGDASLEGTTLVIGPQTSVILK
ncbi:MAG: hypothetical protein K6G60_08845 [Lachnospiraceae bacterium]|nr:hypothetical protein [Lachnospiraceae bacterium]